ncbi:MAG: recombination protein RecR [Erysipelotrichaceae bacterium]|nr:recombination protein RecR [Erysipelotrichaceae bacterium]
MDKLKPLSRLEDSLAKLPSVGRKSAERMAFAMLEMNDEDLNEFVEAIKNLKEEIHYCSECGMLTSEDKCEICSNDQRDKSLLMVVSYPKDVISLEKSNGYNGLYHVLNGELCLAKGRDVSTLNITSLIERVSKGDIKEVIMATNPTVDGETTALYITKLLEPYNVNITRLAYGLQMGGNIDYTDQLTLLKALEGRRKL